MEKIASFQIDHIKLKPGLYVSRKDRFGATTLTRHIGLYYMSSANKGYSGGTTITTFDLRFKAPNKEPVMEIAAMHTIEHLGATFLRSHPEWLSKIVYFGPMGCRTGFYLIVEGDWDSRGILPLMRELLAWVETFDGEIPGASAVECGNWEEQDLETAKLECRRYAEILGNPREEILNYP